MDLKLTEDNEITREELQEQTTLRYLNKAPILHLSSVRDDEAFEGVAYCSKSYVNRDLYDDKKWSGVFYLFDGEGVKFKASFYGMDVKFENHSGPVYIKGVKQYKANNKGREYVEIRLTEITQSTIDCPKSLFLKELPDYVGVKHKFDSNMQKLFINPRYFTFIDTLNKYKMTETLAQESFEDAYGGFIGARLDAFNKACVTIFTIAGNNSDSNINLELCYLGFLLKLWHPTEDIEGFVVDSETSDSMLAQELIYTSNLTKLDKIKLIDCLQDTSKSIEGKLVNDVYNMISNYIYSTDQLRLKTTGKLGLFL